MSKIWKIGPKPPKIEKTPEEAITLKEKDPLQNEVVIENGNERNSLDLLKFARQSRIKKGIFQPRFLDFIKKKKT